MFVLLNTLQTNAAGFLIKLIYALPAFPSSLLLSTDNNKKSETQNLGKGVLYTCALRPGILYGTGKDE